ncbi:hypothetical protein B0675_02085 [Streptomyces sp. M41(2017)]|uniref:hypothetical protein n=1 Tax=Streptomyces sp. M41(2017) TaxID=1955065 RepID=UPI0009BD2959|nr:hypothetical protein [Streptomyces sp. M41(2017)]OQQ16098.1 hypothetical protein B0675_02085 [Streptomyces sp. M41(2017)]
MTTTPSPADLARRARPAEVKQTAPANPLAPARMKSGERFKALYQRGLQMSGMLPEARLVAHTLLMYANHRTGRISPNFQPSREQLAEDTGLDPARIGVQIEVLRQRGWLALTTIAEGPRTGQSRFDMTIPSLYIERIRGPRHTERASLGQPR